MSLENRNITFTWKIENYPLCYLKNKEDMKSPVFTAETLGGSKWYILLYPKGKTEECQEYLSCFLRRNVDDVCTEEIRIKTIIDIAYSKGTTFCSINCNKFEKYKKNSGIGVDKLIKSDRILRKMKTLQDKTLIIRCHLSSEMENTASCEYEAKTRIGVKNYLLKWNVPFSERKDFSERKEVSFQEKSNYEVILSATSDDISIKIEKIEENSPITRVIELKVSLLDIRGTEMTSTTDFHLFNSGETSDVWEFPLQNMVEYLKKSDNYCLKNKTFNLLLEFSASNGIEFQSLVQPKGETFSNVDTLLSLRSDLETLFLKPNFSDATLKSKGKTFRTPRNILSARSPVFRAMFTGENLEKKTGVVEIRDVEENILQSFLKFIYTGTVVCMDYDRATKLLIVADKYQVQSLVEKCACFLISNLSIENAFEVFSISDMLNNKFLKVTALEFIASHRKQLLCTPNWEEWMKDNVKLSTEIYKHLALN